MILLDEHTKFIPLTYDKLFKGIFKDNLELLKLFILEQLEFDVNPDECKIELYDSELPKLNKNEYQKIDDLYVRIHNIYVNVEINREYFISVEKRNLMYADRLYSMILEQGLEQGLMQGLEQGLERGREQGFELGTEQALNKTIKNTLDEKLDISLISRVTGKTEKEINKIVQINLD